MSKPTKTNLTHNQQMLQYLTTQHIKRLGKGKPLPQLPSGGTALIGPSRCGKTYALQQILRGCYNTVLNGMVVPKWNKIRVVTVNEGTGAGWIKFFKDVLKRDIEVLDVDGLRQFYDQVGVEFVETKAQLHVEMQTLIIFDDNSRMTNPSLQEQRTLKNNPIISALFQNARNKGITTVALFQDAVDVPLCVFNNSYLIMFAAPDNIKDRKNHIYPKILDSATKAMPCIKGQPDSVRYAWYDQEIDEMYHYEFMVKMKWEQKLADNNVKLCYAVFIMKA